MSKSKSKFLALFLSCALLLSSFGVTAQAAATPSAPEFTYINFIALSFSITSTGLVLVECTVNARDCTAVGQQLTLQRWDGSSWRNVPGVTWTQKDNGTIGWFSDSSWTVSNGSYRVVNLVLIYVGTQIVEQFEHPSNVFNY